MATITSSVGSSGRNYATIALWQASLPANFVTAGNSYTAELYNDSEFLFSNAGAAVLMQSFTTDATHFMTITAAAGQSWCDSQTHAGAYNVSNGVGIRDTDHRSIVLDIEVDYTVISRLQLSGGRQAIGSQAGHSYTNCTYFNNLMVCYNPTTIVQLGFGGGDNYVLYNNIIIYNSSSDSNVVVFGSGTTNYLFDNTIVRPSDLVASQTTLPLYGVGNQLGSFKNNAIFGFPGTINAGGAGFTGSNNATDQSSITGSTSNQVSLTYTAQFIGTTSSAMDFRVATSGSSLTSTGVAVSSPITISTDAFGQAIPQSGNYPIGATENPPTGNTYAVTIDETGVLSATDTTDGAIPPVSHIVETLTAADGVTAQELNQVVTLVTATGGGTFVVPATLPPGSVIKVEAWGAGAGGSGRSSSSYGAAGAGGAYAASNYTVTPNDSTSGTIAFTVGSGTSGGSGANPAAGGDTSFSTNNVNMITNTINNGVVVGSPGTLPTDWSYGADAAGLTESIIGFGIDPVIDMPYVDVRWVGTGSGTSATLAFTGSQITAGVLQYTFGCYIGLVGGSTANISQFITQWNAQVTGSYLSSIGNVSFTPTSTMTRHSATATNPATTNQVYPYFQFGYSASAAIDITLRFAGVQFEQAAAATFWKSTPGYTLAKGGPGPTGTTTSTGGAGTVTGTIGTLLSFKGGSGANYNVNSSGAGGAGGKDGAGGAGTTGTSGVGGAGDNGSGGAGGAQKTSSPGNPGTSNVEGGGGGGGLRTATGTGGAGGAPGGGGGGASVSVSTGGTGGRGQLRITYMPVYSEIVETGSATDTTSAAQLVAITETGTAADATDYTYVAGAAATTWNPSDKTAAITLSGGNLIATSVGSAEQTVRSTTSKSTGKVYWEVTCTTVQTNICIAVVTAGYQLNAGGGPGADVHSIGFYPVSPAQQLYGNNAPHTSLGSASSNGDVIYWAIDFSNSLVWVSSAVWRAASTPWNGSGSANPSTNTGGLSFATLGLEAGPYFAAFNDSTGGAVGTANFGATTYAGTIPTGFSSWDIPATTTVGSATGSATVSAVGSVQAKTVGSATGSAPTNTAIGSDQANTVGSATGSSTDVATGSSANQTAGSATGSSPTDVAIGSDQAQTVGSATGSSTDAATGSSVAGNSGAGTATGSGTASATGGDNAAMVGSATGVSTDVATGTSQYATVGSASGASATDTATGSAQARSSGAATGSGTAFASDGDLALTIGSASGTSTDAAIASANAQTIASATGSTTGTATGSDEIRAVGAATGTSSDAATGSEQARTAGSATGTSTDVAGGSWVAAGSAIGSAVGGSTDGAVGSAQINAVGTATGSSPTDTAVGSSTTTQPTVGSATGNASTTDATGAAEARTAGSATGSGVAVASDVPPAPAVATKGPTGDAWRKPHFAPRRRLTKKQRRQLAEAGVVVGIVNREPIQVFERPTMRAASSIGLDTFQRFVVADQQELARQIAEQEADDEAAIIALLLVA